MRTCFLVLLLLALGGSHARAQSPLPLQNPTIAAQATKHHSALHVALYTTGGALVGGWAGYVASQVAWSDWRNEPGRREQRLRFSLAGATLGLVGGFLIGHRTPAPDRVIAEAPPPDARQDPITEREIRASSARYLSQLVREIRPQWFRSRGRDVIRPNPDPVEAPGVRVYLNGGLLGGLDTLDQVSIDAVTRIEFFESGAAVLRWGAGNEDGAILLTTRASD